MAYLRGFEHDVFISYAHENNDPPLAGEKGWIDEFAEQLNIFLRNYIGRPEGLSIWKDDALPGNADFQQTIDKALQSTAVLVVVYSPGYVNSPFCKKEWEGFVEGHAQLKVGDAWRLFKVQHSPLRSDQQDPLLAYRLPGYAFFEGRPFNKGFDPFRPTERKDPDQRYWDKLRTLATDLGDLLIAMNGGPTVEPSSGKTVYLAQVTPDLTLQRDAVASFLTQRGVRVLPNELPSVATDLETAIRASLQASDVSVHLASDTPGDLVTGDSRTLRQVQYDLAQEQAQRIPRIVWIRGDLEKDNLPGNLSFLKSLELERDAPMVLRSGVLDDLQDRITLTLFPAAPATAIPAANAEPGPTVYVACDSADQHYAAELQQCLFNSNLEVFVSLRTESLRQYKSQLNACKGLLLVYGSTTAEWVRERALIAAGMADRRKKKPLLVMSIYDAPPKNKADLNLQFHSIPILPCRDCETTQDCTRLRDFIGRLRQ
ncbi:MAG: toll/interleukin-1 receptor domain-containing protein [Acidobacteriia bacterium]|nr:toll/interleukin-1 receptor domain-containing protein [Terriglobia bacterium]